MRLLTLAPQEKDQFKIVAVLRQLIERFTRGRETLTADRTFYVRSDASSDNNSGLANTTAEAFLTIQAAVDAALALDANNHSVTIQIADGTYNTGATAVSINTPLIGAPNGPLATLVLTIQGNSSTPGNVIVTSSDLYTFLVQYGAVVQLKDFEVRNSNASAYGAVSAFYQAAVLIDGMQFGTMAGTAHMLAGNLGSVTCVGAYTVTGPASYHFWATDFGLIQTFAAVAFSGTVTMVAGFLLSEGLGFIDIELSGAMFSGIMAGRQYDLDSGGGLVVGQGNTLPGTLPGRCDNGGWYDKITPVQNTMTLGNGANNNVAREEAGLFFKITGPTGAFSISGFVKPTTSTVVQQMVVQNRTTQDMTITNLATSTAGNQIMTLTGADVVLTGISVATFFYSSADTAWVLQSTQG